MDRREVPPEFERGGGPAPMLQVGLDQLSVDARSVPAENGTLADDPVFCAKLADLAIRVDVLEVLEHRVLAVVAGGGNPGAASSMLKILGTELSQALTTLTLEAAGPRGRAYQPHVTAGWPGRRVHPARRRLSQRRAVAGGGAVALFQRSRRVDLCRFQRDSTQHPRQGPAGSLTDKSEYHHGFQPHRRTTTPEALDIGFSV